MPTATERKIIRQSPITLRVRGAEGRGPSVLGQAAEFFRGEGDDLVFRSSLGSGHSISEHLKWMLGMIQHNAADFKRARHSGWDIVLQIRSEAAEFRLDPEALLLPHKLQLPVEISIRP